MREIYHQMTEEDRKEIIRLRTKEVASIPKICKAVGMSRSAILRYLQKIGLAERHGFQTAKLPRSRYRKVSKEYLSGLPMSALAIRHSVSISIINKALIATGTPLRDNAASHHKDIANKNIHKLISMYTTGNLSQAKIGKRFGISSNLVARALRENGVFKPGAARGHRHGLWKGGVHINNEGYRCVKIQDDSPFVSMRMSNGYVPEHRLVVAQTIGRPLTSKEAAHHKDGNRLNNDPSNLQLRQLKHGNGQCFVCADCGSQNVIATDIQ